MSSMSCMAHVLGKKVILITSDEIDEAPTDIKCYEFIRYRLDDHRGFLEKLEGALRGVLSSEYQELYKFALQIFPAFCSDNGYHLDPASEADFVRQATQKSRNSQIPPLEDERAVARFVLPLVAPSPVDIDLMIKIDPWIEKRYGASTADMPPPPPDSAMRSSSS